MVEEVRWATIPLLPALWMSIEVCILSFIYTRRMLALFPLPFSQFVHSVFDMLPQDKIFGEVFEDKL